MPDKGINVQPCDMRLLVLITHVFAQVLSVKYSAMLLQLQFVSGLSVKLLDNIYIYAYWMACKELKYMAINSSQHYTSTQYYIV